MTAKIKFTFYLKNGQLFVTIVEVTQEEFNNIIEATKAVFLNNAEGSIALNDCMVRLSDCSVVEWEEV